MLICQRCARSLKKLPLDCVAPPPRNGTHRNAELDTKARGEKNRSQCWTCFQCAGRTFSVLCTKRPAKSKFNLKLSALFSRRHNKRKRLLSSCTMAFGLLCICCCCFLQYTKVAPFKTTSSFLTTTKSSPENERSTRNGQVETLGCTERHTKKI